MITTEEIEKMIIFNQKVLEYLTIKYSYIIDGEKKYFHPIIWIYVGMEEKVFQEPILM